MKTEFDVKLTVGDMFVFLMNHTYRKLINIIIVLFSVAMIVVVILTWGRIQLYQSILLLVFAAMFTIVNPILLFFKAMRQYKKNKALREPLHYMIDDSGVTVSQGDKVETAPWENMWKAVKYGRLVLLYMSTMRACNIPMRCIGNQYNDFVRIVNDGMKERCHLKTKA